MHLYYFPVILLSYHYRRTGIILSALLGALYVAIVTFYTYPALQEIAGAVVRFCVFIGISLVVAYLSSLLNLQQISRQTLFDRASGGFLFVNRQDITITDINPFCIRLLGYERNELIGKSLSAICSFSHGDILTPETIVPELPDESREVRIRTKDGNEKAAILTIGEFPDDQYVLTITDINRLKEVEAALTESENKFRGVTERSSDLIMLTDTEAEATYVSPSIKQILGVEPENAVGKGPDDFLDPENLRKWMELIQKTVGGEDTKNVVIRADKPDGSISTVEFSSTPIYEEGRITGVQLVGRDIAQEIADRAIIDELMQKQKEQLSIINQSPAVAFLWRAEEDWPVEMVSDNITQFGYTPQDFLSGAVLFSAIIHPDDLAQVEEEVTYYSDHAIDTFKQIYRIYGSDQQVYWIEDFTTIRHNEAGEITHYQGIILNITTRKIAEEGFKREKAIVESILASLPGMFYMFKMVDQGGKFVRWNKNLEKITGYSKEELGDMTPLDNIKEEDKSRISAAIEKAVSQGYTEEEAAIVTKSGKEIPFFFSATEQEIEGEHYIIGLALDISDRIKAEEALRIVNNKLNLLSSITRHDIINQVMGAEMLLEMVETDSEISLDSKTKDDLKNIAGALRTIERQIVFTRDYQDLGVHSPDWQNVGQIIDKTAPTISNGPAIENEVGSLTIYADPLFEKVIYNLLDNAARHGEKITSIRFFSEETSDGLKLVCEDDGVGVPADVKEKIFKRQYYKHTGLGLFLSREILSITGMTITETGDPGIGARFEILVPDGMWRRE